MMKEGTVPVPPLQPLTYRDDDVTPVRGLSHLGGAEAAGGNPVSVQFFNFL